MVWSLKKQHTEEQVQVNVPCKTAIRRLGLSRRQQAKHASESVRQVASLVGTFAALTQLALLYIVGGNALPTACSCQDKAVSSVGHVTDGERNMDVFPLEW